MSKPTTFSRTVDGKTETRLAHTPADAVKFRFEGWREVADEAKTKTAAVKAEKAAQGDEATPAK